MPDIPAQRLLHLLSLLQTPREWPGSELAERLRVTARTIRRDVDRLRELGYPVEATMGAAGGYRLVAGAAMPPLLLDDAEAVAVAIGLRVATGQAIAGIEEASVRALTKLEQVLPAKLRRRVRTLGAATDPLNLPPALSSSPAPPVHVEHLATFAAAITNGERARFRYSNVHGTESPKHVDPHRLVPIGRRWYLLAHDLDRDDWRTYRLDRITQPRATGARITPREIPGGDAAAFVQAKLFSSAPTYHAIVVLDTPIEHAAHRFARAELEPLDERRCLLRGSAETLEWIAIRLIVLGCDFEVQDPPELLDYIGSLGERFVRAARQW